MNDGSGERTAIVGKTGLVSWKNQAKTPVGQKTPTTTTQPVPVHRLKQTNDKQPEPLCILGCCGRGSLLILWTVGQRWPPTSQLLLLLGPFVFSFYSS